MRLSSPGCRRARHGRPLCAARLRNRLGRGFCGRRALLRRGPWGHPRGNRDQHEHRVPLPRPRAGLTAWRLTLGTCNLRRAPGSVQLCRHRRVRVRSSLAAPLLEGAHPQSVHGPDGPCTAVAVAGIDTTGTPIRRLASPAATMSAVRTRRRRCDRKVFLIRRSTGGVCPRSLPTGEGTRATSTRTGAVPRPGRRPHRARETSMV